MISYDHLTKIYGEGKDAVTALEGVSFDIQKGETALNWVHTAKALLNRDFQEGMQFFGHHYVLLDQCLRKRYGDKAVDIDSKFLRNIHDEQV